jgi:hypothetical protein
MDRPWVLARDKHTGEYKVLPRPNGYEDADYLVYDFIGEPFAERLVAVEAMEEAIMSHTIENLRDNILGGRVRIDAEQYVLDSKPRRLSRLELALYTLAIIMLAVFVLELFILFRGQ